MIAIQRYKTIILILISGVILYLSWSYFLRDKSLSMLSQTAEITELETSKKIRLRKHKGQGFVHGIDLEITGTSDRTLMLMMGESDTVMNQVIQLKKGKIDFSYTGDWYTDDCYIFCPSDPGVNVYLEIDYRFLSSN